MRRKREIGFAKASSLDKPRPIFNLHFFRSSRAPPTLRVFLRPLPTPKRAPLLRCNSHCTIYRKREIGFAKASSLDKPRPIF